MATNLDMGAIRATLEKHMECMGLTGRQLSRKAGLNETAVRDLLVKVEDPRFGTLVRLADALNTSPATLFGGTVEIVGTINEHGEILPKEANGMGFEAASRPPDLIGEALAYYVDTSALWPAHRHGDIVFVGREIDAMPDQFLGQECVVQIAATGSKLLRTVLEGTVPGRFTLRLFESGQDIENVQLAWAAPVHSTTRKRPNGQM